MCLPSAWSSLVMAGSPWRLQFLHLPDASTGDHTSGARSLRCKGHHVRREKPRDDTPAKRKGVGFSSHTCKLVPSVSS